MTELVIESESVHKIGLSWLEFDYVDYAFLYRKEQIRPVLSCNWQQHEGISVTLWLNEPSGYPNLSHSKNHLLQVRRNTPLKTITR